MRKPAGYMIGSAFALLLLSGGMSPSTAQTAYPWCAHYWGADIGGAINCGFTSLQQCLATVNGIGGTCEMNGNFTPSAGAPARTPKRRITAAQ